MWKVQAQFALGVVCIMVLTPLIHAWMDGDPWRWWVGGASVLAGLGLVLTANDRRGPGASKGVAPRH